MYRECSEADESINNIINQPIALIEKDAPSVLTQGRIITLQLNRVTGLSLAARVYLNTE